MSLQSQEYNKADLVIDNGHEAEGISFKQLIIKLKEWFNYVLSKWLFIGCFIVIGGLLGFAYAKFKKPLYTATSTFVLEESGSSSGGAGQYAGLASMVGINIGGGSGGGIFQGDNLLELYKSRLMIQKALLSPINQNENNELVVDRYIKANKLAAKWEDKPELKGINFHLKKGALFSRTQDSLLADFVLSINKNNLVVSKPDKKLSIIRVDVISTDETFSKVFNDQLVANVNNFYVQTKTKKSNDNVSILQHQTDSVKAVLTGAIYSGASVMDATPNLNVTRMILRAPAQRSQFNAEANKAILGELVKNLEIAKVSLRRETPLIQIIDAPIFPLTVVKFGKAKGLIIGFLAGGFIAVLIILTKKVFRDLIS